MSQVGKSHLVLIFTVEPEDVAEGDRIFSTHGEWMRGHPSEGPEALLGYTVSKGPEVSNPLDPNSEPTGRTTFVVDEYFESAAGIARHLQDAADNWAEMSSALPQWASRAKTILLHNGSVIHAR